MNLGQNSETGEGRPKVDFIEGMNPYPMVGKAGSLESGPRVLAVVLG